MTHFDYGFRIYNPGIARFLSVDPLTKKFPELTPYQFASNTPISAIDLDGQEAIHYKVVIDRNTNSAAITYSHSEDIIDEVIVVDRRASQWLDPGEHHIETRVNDRQSIVFDVYDPGYGKGRKGRTQTYSQKSEEFRSKDYSNSALSGSGYAEAYSFDAYDLGAAFAGQEELSDAEKDQFDSDFTLAAMSFLPISRLFSGTNWVKVGRWMSPEELALMENSGKLQMGAGNQTSIILEGAVNKESFKAATKGSVFVEFEIKASTHIGQGGKNVWGTIFGPKSSIGKILSKRGVKLETPTVRKINVVDKQ